MVKENHNSWELVTNGAWVVVLRAPCAYYQTCRSACPRTVLEKAKATLRSLHLDGLVQSLVCRLPSVISDAQLGRAVYRSGMVMLSQLASSGAR